MRRLWLGGVALSATLGLLSPGPAEAWDRGDFRNQGDEIVVVDPSGKVVAKKGDFNGVASDGSIHGLLFPASLVFSPNKSRLYITNLALYLPFAGVPTIAVDSDWARQVQHNIAVIDIPP